MNRKRLFPLRACALVFFALFECTPAFALRMFFYPINTSTYPFGANDLHLTLESAGQMPLLTVTGGTLLNPAVITGQGSKKVTIDFTTVGNQAVRKGESVYVEINLTPDVQHPNAIFITRACWTHDLLVIEPNGCFGIVTPVFPGFESTPRPDFDVYKVTTYIDGPLCCVMSGEFFFQTPHTGLAPPIFVNAFTEPVLASIASGLFDHEVPLDEFNRAVVGLGPDSPIATFAPISISAVPEPASWLLLCAGFIGLVVATGGSLRSRSG